MLYIPRAYAPTMDIRRTEIAIKQIKDFFERALAEALNLTRVSAPLFVFSETGLNDNLSGVERPVAFDVPAADKNAEIVQSLSKWKRVALKRYGFRHGEGLYTDMNAIRRDEDFDNLHSIYVDQWDWERIIAKDERNTETLKETVGKLYGVFKATERYITGLYPFLASGLPESITFITSQELADAYPGLTAKEREDAACREHGAVFLSQIGDKLASGEPHDRRAPDYDDWLLNGDILFWYDTLGKAVEMTSMGVRVDEASLDRQLRQSGCEDRRTLPYHRSVLAGELPYTVGGGLGQSRICMYFLGKAHIGEVHASVWDEATLRECERGNIRLL